MTGHFTSNYLIASFTSQFSYLLLINKVTYTIYNYIVNEIHKRITYLNEKNKMYMMPVIVAFAYVMMYSNFLYMKSNLITIFHLPYRWASSFYSQSVCLFFQLTLLSLLEADYSSRDQSWKERKYLNRQIYLYIVGCRSIVFQLPQAF